MAIRALNQLTTRRVDTAGDGSYLDGGGLYLYVSNEGKGRSWVFRYTSPITRRVREMGLGRAGQGGVSLAAAREERDRLRAMICDGLDPLDQRKRRIAEQAGKRSFIEVARLTLERKVTGFKGGKDGSSYAQWCRTLNRDTKALHALAIDAIAVADIKRVVSPMWDDGRFETARATLGRLETIFAFACAHGWRSDNPAQWSTFRFIAPDAPDVKSHAMIAWADAPAVVAKLRRSASMGALALEFIILTAARLSEAREAEFSEIDFDKAVWTIPPERMKRGLEHAVPLSTRAIAIVAELRRLRPQAGIIFPAAHGGTMTKQGIWATCCRMTGDKSSVHGFRACFRSWAADHGMPFDLAEASLAHSRGAVVEAYMRTGMIERRRPWMQAWADYLSGEAAANVIPLRAAE
jgi:integrase